MRTRPLLLTAALTSGLLTALPATRAAAAPARYADDFDGDGYRDVAVGAAGAVVPGKQTAGAVVVLYGSPSGPSAARRAVITQNSPGVPGAAEEGDRFGAALTAGDLDGDGDTGLTVTSRPTTRVQEGPWKRTGAPKVEYDIDELGSTRTVIAGDLSGDGAAERLYPFGFDGDVGGAIFFGPARFGIATTGTPSFGAPLRG